MKNALAWYHALGAQDDPSGVRHQAVAARLAAAATDPTHPSSVDFHALVQFGWTSTSPPAGRS